MFQEKKALRRLPTDGSQELILVDFKLFQNIRKQVSANGFSRVNWNRSAAAVMMMKYCVTTFLSQPLESQYLKPPDNLSSFK
ncbi:MAG: hypothetical protein AMJ37_03320 [Dehalococcoidia bacterium DG_18]|nr:MAG: hypothetical protein AMJ37_03320 [Dehalococcoidia bacterium DG_18]